MMKREMVIWLMAFTNYTVWPTGVEMRTISSQTLDAFCGVGTLACYSWYTKTIFHSPHTQEEFIAHEIVHALQHAAGRFGETRLFSQLDKTTQNCLEYEATRAAYSYARGHRLRASHDSVIWLRIYRDLCARGTGE